MLIMLSLIVSFLISLAVAFVAFRAARGFVRERLRYVDAAQRGSTPWLAGGAAFVIGAILSSIFPSLLPVTLTFALAIGTGVAAGARDIRSGNHYLGDGF